MTEAQALTAIQEAFYRGRYVLDPHVLKRMQQRNVSFHEIKDAVMIATRAEAYADPKRPLIPGASSWRVFGVDFEGDELTLGIDLTQDHLGAFAVVVTVF